MRRTLEIEANAATDNPLVFAEEFLDAPAGTIVSGGNFHGQPLSLPLMLVLIGIPLFIVAHIALGIWIAYRVIRGWLALRDARPMYV